jgi:phosphoserine phosphatase
VIDRDDRSEQEIIDCGREGARVLRRRTLESYLFDEEILRKLCEREGKSDRADEVLKALEQAVTDSVARGNPRDDLKSAAGSFYTNAKRILEIPHAGSTAEAFCRDTLTPLVTADTTVYALLREDVFCWDEAAGKPQGGK